MTTASGMVKVRLRGSQPYEMETLWATPVEGGVAEFFPKYTTPSNYGGVYVYVMLKCTHLNCAAAEYAAAAVCWQPGVQSG